MIPALRLVDPGRIVHVNETVYNKFTTKMIDTRQILPEQDLYLLKIDKKAEKFQVNP